MPTATRSRTVTAPLEDMWALIGDPHHLPRWWPRVERVEDVRDGAFTEVMRTAKGKVVRADFELARLDPNTRSLCWQQRLLGTPFERLLTSAETEISLAPMGTGTQVTIELRQTLNGFLARIGSFMVRRAAVATVDEALANLERIVG
ncbi:MAG TPA: SRPBCC family protein [Solirubrobacteraceae bacterium]|nr:SRPBCC family protein [Solirubrobacteraceae bacterium]